MQNRKNVKKRNISLRLETNERLEKHKIKHMSEKENSRIAFNNVMTSLLDRALQESQVTG